MIRPFNDVDRWDDWDARPETTPGPVLVAEPVLEDAKRLVQHLTLLGHSVRVALSAAEALDLFRRELFTRAVVASELMLGEEPVLGRLSQLPILERLVATGPAGDPSLELRARRAGAAVYLVRPVSVDAVAAALAAAGYAGTADQWMRHGDLG